MKVGSHKGPTTTSKNDLRVTKIGKFLRTTKLDEFPQLINILFGQMSMTKRYGIPISTIIQARFLIQEVLPILMQKTSRTVMGSLEDLLAKAGAKRGL